MPIQIGGTTHSFAEPTGLLSDCHRRVEMFLGVLMKIAEGNGCSLSEEARHSLEQALRYFREAAPKHTADEEESLFPRLRQTDNAEVKAALSLVDELEKDHRWAEPLHKQVDALGSHYALRGYLSVEQAEQFQGAVARLAEMYRRHIEVEDRQLFPAAFKALTPEQKVAIASEMAARRDIPCSEKK
jgi:hemerythrin-like domain-containing protein